MVSYDGEADSTSELNMYLINDFVVKVLTRPIRCSYMELVSAHA